jgi:membrane protein
VRRVQESGFDPVEVAGSAWGATVAGWRRAPRFVRGPIVVGTRTFRAYSADHCNIYAAAIAYYSLFSVVPLLIVTLAVLGLVVSEDRVVEFIYDQFPLERSEDVNDTLTEIVRTTKNLSGAALAIGAVTLAWSASGVFSAIRQGLNAVSHEKRGHSFFRGKAIDVALVPVLGAVIFVALIANAVTQVALDELSEWEPLVNYRDAVWKTVSVSVAALITFGFFLLLYRFIPSTRPSWKQAAAGALLATVLFEIVRNVAALIIEATPFDGSGALYASLATALAFLYVMRIMGSVLLVGAVFGRVVAGPRREPAADLAEDAVPGV